MLTIAHPQAGDECLVPTGPIREAVVSWNARELEGAIELRVNAQDGRTSAWMPYVAFDSDRRASLDGRDTFVRLETDVMRSDVDLVAVGVRSRGPVDAVFISTPDYGAQSTIVALPALELAVPPASQYHAAYPDERNWCAPTCLAMLLAYRGYPVDVPVVVREVFDARYGGTGNWAFNAAFAARLGFRAAALHLRDLAHAHAFLADDLPLALSISWDPGELAGAPLERSAGHIVVLRGIDENGDAMVNDPAHPALGVTYPRGAFERAWLGHGGIAIVVAPAPLGESLVRLANA
jgi:Peptidase_C39 like family